MEIDGALYRFSMDECDWLGSEMAEIAAPKVVLGGKGAALVAMCQAGLRVPPGFTIPTSVCNQFRKLQADYGTNSHQVDALLELVSDEVLKQMAWLEAGFGYRPLVSVRSGAPVSMPGMMDTILNVGISATNIDEWADRIGLRPALDSYRRLIQMLGATAYGVPEEAFKGALEAAKQAAGVEIDAALSEERLVKLICAYEEIFTAHTGKPFPQSWDDQLCVAIRAVFASWMNPRAIEYRKLNGLDDAMGTAATVQAMVFGNMGATSGSGVLFTRNPSTGEKKIMGEYLPNAQGEDVVAGIRTPDPLGKWFALALSNAGLEWTTELAVACEALEAFPDYRDMVDVEFTVQEGVLYVLQSRVGKRSAQAAFKIAVDLAAEGVIDVAEALRRLTADQFKITKRPSLDPGFAVVPQLTGLPACPGVAFGRPVFSAAEAVAAKGPVVLVTHETTPDDIAGMAAAVGILTQTGGATSHAAVVARAMDKPCVVGATALDLGQLKSQVAAGALTRITIDGATGHVWIGLEVPVVNGAESEPVLQVTDWCIERSKLAVSTPAPLAEAVPQVIRAADWWGSEEMMHAVLDDMATAPGDLCLDVREPAAFRPGIDCVLEDAFGGQPPDGFREVLAAALAARAEELSHVTVVGQGTACPPAAPKDFIVFSVLAH